MFHKRSLKRSINTSDTTSDDHATSWKSLQPKRLRTEDYSEQTKAQDDSAVRRSSRAPKPKVFDDDYTDIGVRSPGSEHETLKNKEPRSLSRNQGERSSVDDEEFAKRRSSRVPKPKLFDKEYLETAKSRGTEDKEEKKMAFATAVRVSQDWQKESSFQKGPTKCKKTTMSVSKQGKTDVSASAAGGRQPRPAMKGNEGPGASETPKVRTSLRTPMPKKIFALIDDSPVSRTGEGDEGLFEGDLYVDIVTQESHATKHSKKVIISQSELDIIGTSPISSKKNWTSTDAGNSHGGKHKKLKKLNTAMVDSSTFLYSEAEAPKKCDTIKKQSEAKEKFKNISSKATNKTSGKIFKKRTSKNKPTDVSEDVVDVVVGIQQMEGKKKSKKKKAEVEQSELPSVSPDMLTTMSTGIEHGKNGSKHSKVKHKDEPHSEVKDKGHHIILKVHLPHGEPHHSHSHKKHKHKHSSETKTESGSSESKLKKAKSSHESDASTSADKQRKKLSIKFKGLSSSTPGVEFQGTENIAKTEKKNKEMERVPNKKKPAKSSLDKLCSGSDDKEHVKVVIKKNKKDLEVIPNEGQKPSKKLSKSTGKDVTEKKKEGHGKAETPIKTTSPKKKMKTSESPKSTEKEKRKIVTGYLLFCKKERSRIHEAHPGLEFAQISQKVGEAWKSLPESIKQEWKAKADYVKKNLTPTKEDKKTEATKPGPDAIDMAAHLKLLGESLSVIGGSLMAQKETEVHGSLSVLLDSILCAICPLTFLTSHIPGIPGISKETQTQILDDLAYTMPGLG